MWEFGKNGHIIRSLKDRKREKPTFFESMGVVKDEIKDNSTDDGSSLDMQDIMGRITEIEDGIRKSTLQLAVLKEIVRNKKGKKKRIVGWTERRPGADARKSGYVKRDRVGIKNRVEFKEMKYPVKKLNVCGEVVDVIKRFVIVCCENPEGVHEWVAREPHNIELIE